MNVLATELGRFFPRVTAHDFYRFVFPPGELDRADAFTPGKYVAVAVEIFHRREGENRQIVHRFSVCDDLAVVDQLQGSKEFCILAPISYAGKTRSSKNARFMYALVVELDNLIEVNGEQRGLHALINLWCGDHPYLPRPTFLVASGNGVHLYYVFEKAVPLFKNVVEGLAEFKRALTRMVWNAKTTTDHEEEKIQFESIFQAFRMVGTRTKSGDRVEAFRCGGAVTIQYMNSFIEKQVLYKTCTIPEIYKSELTLAEAKKKYPEWYQSRIVEGKPRGKWDYSNQKGHRGDEIYNWWFNRVKNEAAVGHRYYCLMCLAIYAIKCDIPEDRLLNDMYELLPILDERTIDEENHLTIDDVVDAMQAYYDESLYTYPAASIQNRSGLEIKKNKRNGRTQEAHLRYMRMQRDFKVSEGECSAGGRPDKAELVVSYVADHPWESKSEIARNLCISRPTVHKYYEEGLDRAEREVEKIIDAVRRRRTYCDDMGIEIDDATGEVMDEGYWKRATIAAFYDRRCYEWYLGYPISEEDMGDI